MQTFLSRLNYRRYFVGLFTLTMPFMLAVLGIGVLLQNIHDGHPWKEWGITLVMPFLGIFYIITTLIHYYRKSPKISINDHEIWIGGKVISVSDIVLVTVRGKSSDTVLFVPYTFESSSLLLADGNQVAIAVENYDNGNVIRMNLSRLNDFVLGKVKHFQPVASHGDDQLIRHPIDINRARTFRLMPWKSFNNVLFLGMCLLAIVVAFDISRILLLVFPAIVVVLFYSLLIKQNHYFLITDNHLVVRCLFLPRWERAFRLDDIQIVETEEVARQQTALKLMTSDYRIYRFQSGLMNYEMFEQLIRAIQVRRGVSLAQTLFQRNRQN
ncbi:MAG TPA: hypothetical protein VK658_09210 [Chryseolinea sp.]|nr:hypothetical protein [Chryseolinea sp.]